MIKKQNLTQMTTPVQQICNQRNTVVRHTIDNKSCAKVFIHHNNNCTIHLAGLNNSTEVEVHENHNITIHFGSVNAVEAVVDMDNAVEAVELAVPVESSTIKYLKCKILCPDFKKQVSDKTQTELGNLVFSDILGDYQYVLFNDKDVTGDLVKFSKMIEEEESMGIDRSNMICYTIGGKYKIRTICNNLGINCVDTTEVRTDPTIVSQLLNGSHRDSIKARRERIVKRSYPTK